MQTENFRLLHADCHSARPLKMFSLDSCQGCLQKHPVHQWHLHSLESVILWHSYSDWRYRKISVYQGYMFERLRHHRFWWKWHRRQIILRKICMEYISFSCELIV